MHLATHTIVFTITLLQQIALGIIAAAGCYHLLMDCGAGQFTCSRYWLSDLFRQKKWSFGKQQAKQQ
jgi:hypothetical protein